MLLFLFFSFVLDVAARKRAAAPKKKQVAATKFKAAPKKQVAAPKKKPAPTYEHIQPEIARHQAKVANGLIGGRQTRNKNYPSLLLGPKGRLAFPAGILYVKFVQLKSQSHVTPRNASKTRQCLMLPIKIQTNIGILVDIVASITLEDLEDGKPNLRVDGRRRNTMYFLVH